MAYTANNLIKIAQAEIGYKEKVSKSNLDDKTANAGSNNYTKYARDLHEAKYYQANKNGYAWCDVFVDWCFYKLTGSKEKGEYLECQTGLYGAGCVWSSSCYRKAGRFDKNPQPGDQIFFGKTGDEEHTGIVEKIENGKVHTIEGNASNRVERRTYSLTSSYIVGYGHPRFDLEEDPVTPEQRPADEELNSTTTPAVPESNTPNSSIMLKVGDIVDFVGNKHYASANASTGISCKPGKAKITGIYQLGKSKHPYHLINISNGGASVYGWVNASDILGNNIEQDKEIIESVWVPKIGDIVNYTGNKHYSSADSTTGKTCKGGKAKITSIYRLGASKHPYHLVRVSGGGATVYGWVDKDSFSKA